MKLVIDIGNTRTKVGFFEKSTLVDLQILEDLSATRLENLINSHSIKQPQFLPVKHSILGSVRNYPDEIRNLLVSRYQFIELNPDVPLPIKLKYQTPETLGKDRIALAVAGSGTFPDCNVLIIGAGTCITYDFINRNKEYFGGAISPGIRMRFKALNTFTDKLPLVSLIDHSELVGNSTESSIRSGVLNGVVAEVNGIIERYVDQFTDLKIILTGGDANYFDKRLKNNIFANSNLVLEGLNMILDYNVGT
jgi:type III pantothenate kinase